MPAKNIDKLGNLQKTHHTMLSVKQGKKLAFQPVTIRYIEEHLLSPLPIGITSAGGRGWTSAKKKRKFDENNELCLQPSPLTGKFPLFSPAYSSFMK